MSLEGINENLGTQRIMFNREVFDVHVAGSKEALGEFVRRQMMPGLFAIDQTLKEFGFENEYEADIGVITVLPHESRFEVQNFSAAKEIRDVFVRMGFDVPEIAPVEIGRHLPSVVNGRTDLLKHREADLDSYLYCKSDAEDGLILIAPVCQKIQTDENVGDCLHHPEKYAQNIDFRNAVVVSVGDFMDGEAVPIDQKIRNPQVVSILRRMMAGV